MSRILQLAQLLKMLMQQSEQEGVASDTDNKLPLEPVSHSDGLDVAGSKKPVHGTDGQNIQSSDSSEVSGHFFVLI